MNRRRGRPRSYDWRALFAPLPDCRTFEFTLVRGRDYTCRTHSMAQQIRGQASARDVSVSIRETDDDVTALVLS